jgi:hypothetical protein
LLCKNCSRQRHVRSFYSIRSGWNIALNRRFQFQKRRQLFIRTHNETLSVAMCVSNPDCSADFKSYTDQLTPPRSTAGFCSQN